MREIGSISNKAVGIYQSLGFHGDTSGVPQGAIAQFLRENYGDRLKGYHQDLMNMDYFALQSAKETKKRSEDALRINPNWHSAKGDLDKAKRTIEKCERGLNSNRGVEPYKDHMNTLRNVAVDYIQKGLEYINREYDNLKLPLNDNSFKTDYTSLMEKIREKQENGNKSKTTVLSLVKDFNNYVKKIDDAIVQNQAKLNKDLDGLKKEDQLVSSFSEQKLIETEEKIKVLQTQLKSPQEDDVYFLSDLLLEVQMELANKKTKDLVNFLDNYKNEGDSNFYDDMNDESSKLQSLTFKTSLDQKVNESEYSKYVKISEISNKRNQPSLKELNQDIQEMESIKKGYSNKKIQGGLIESHQQFHGEILATMKNMLGVMDEKMKELGINPALFLGENLKNRYDMAIEDVARTNLFTKKLSSIRENFFELLKGFDSKYFEIEKVLQTSDLDKKSILQLIEIKEALGKIQQQPSLIEENKKDQYVVVTENVSNQLMAKLSLKKEELDQKSIIDLIKLKNDLKNPKLSPLSNEDEQRRNVSLNLLNDAISEKKAILKTLSVIELINLHMQFQALKNEEQVKEDVLDITTYLKVLIQSIHIRDNEVIQSLRTVYTPINDLVHFKEAGETLHQMTNALLKQVDRAVNEMQENYNDETVINRFLVVLPTYQDGAKEIIAQVAYLKEIDELPKRFESIDQSIPESFRDSFENSKVTFDKLLNDIRVGFSKGRRHIEESVHEMDKLVRFWELRLLEKKYIDAFDRLWTAINILPKERKSALLKLANEMDEFADYIKVLRRNHRKDIAPEKQHSEILKYSKELDELIEEINQETEKEKLGITDGLLKEARESFSALDMTLYGLQDLAQLKKVGTSLNEKIRVIQENIWESIQKIQAGEMDIKLAVAEITAFKKQANRINGLLELFKTYDNQLNALVARFEKAMQSIPENWKKQAESEKFTNLLNEVESLILQGYDPSDLIAEMDNKTLSIEKTARISELMALQQNIQASLDQVNALAWLLPERKEELQYFEKQLHAYSTEIIKLNEKVKTSIIAEQVNDLGQVISDLEKEVKTFSTFSEFKANTKDEIVAIFENKQRELLDEAGRAYERLEAFKGQVYRSERDQYFDALNSIVKEAESLKLLDQDGNLDLSQIAKLHQLRKELTESGAKCKESLIALYRQLEVSDVVEKRHEEIERCVSSDAFGKLVSNKNAMDDMFRQIGVGLQGSVPENQQIPVVNVVSRSLNPFDDDVLESNNPFDNDGRSLNPFDDEVEPSVEQPVEKDLFTLLEEFQAYQAAKDTYEAQCHDALKEVYYPQKLGLEFMTFLVDAQSNFINKYGEHLLKQSELDKIRVCFDELSALESVPLDKLNVNHVYAFQTIQSRLMSFEIEIKERVAKFETQEIRTGIKETTAYKSLEEKRDRLQNELDKAKEAFIKPSNSWFKKTQDKIDAITECLEVVGDEGLKLSAIEGAVEILKNSPRIRETRGVGLGKVETIDLMKAFVKAAEEEINKAGDLSGLDTVVARREREEIIIPTYVNPFITKLQALEEKLLQLPDAIKALAEEQLLEWNTKRSEISNKVKDFNGSVKKLVEDGKGNTVLTQYIQLSLEINQFNDELQNAEKELKQAEAERIRAENKEIIKTMKSDYEKLELPDGYEKFPHDNAKNTLKQIKTLLLELDGLVDNREAIELKKAELERKAQLFGIEKDEIQENINKAKAPLPKKLLNTLEEVGSDIGETVKKGGNEVESFFRNVLSFGSKVKDTVVDTGENIIQGVGQGIGGIGDKIFNSPKSDRKLRISSNRNIHFSNTNQDSKHYDFVQMGLDERLSTAQKVWLNQNREMIEKEISQLIFDGYDNRETSFAKQAKNIVKSFQDDQIRNFEKSSGDTTGLRNKLIESCGTCKEFIDKAFGLSDEEKKDIIQAAVTARLMYLLDHPKNWNEGTFVQDMTEKAFYEGYFFRVYEHGGKSLYNVMDEVKASGNDEDNKITIGEIGENLKSLPIIHEVATGVDNLVDKAKELPGVGSVVSGISFVGRGITSLVGSIEIKKPTIDGNLPVFDKPVQLLFHKTLSDSFMEKNRYLTEAKEEYGKYEFLEKGGHSYRNNSNTWDK